MAQKVLALRSANIVWTACPSGGWTDALERLLRSRGGPYRFIDIGCNKGYTSSEFFARWAPELGFTPKALQAVLPDKHCGYCNDCNSTYQAAPRLSTGGTHPSVEVVCVEPNQMAFAQLVQVRDQLLKDPSKNWAQWHLVNAACGEGGSLPKYVSFPRCKEAREECGLGVASDIVLGHDTLPMLSVDSLLEMYGWDHVDVLKMDTEGYDAPAVRSALTSLLGGKVGVLYFEYNAGGAWASETLEGVVDWLEGLDFVCYLAGNSQKPASEEGSLAQLTGCWSPRLEYKHWSNVVCMARSHPLYPEAERMSLRYAIYRAEYYSHDKDGSQI